MSRAAQKRNPGRGSQRLHRALGGTRILLAAAPTAPPCFCRWQRSSLLHRGFPPPDYSAGRCCSNPPLRRFTNFRIKQKLQCHYNTGVLGGRGWITQAAHLKKPRRGFFPRRTVRRVDAVRIHPPSLREGYYKTETPVPGSDTGVLGGAKQPKSEPLPSGASLAVISSNVMVFVPSL